MAAPRGGHPQQRHGLDVDIPLGVFTTVTGVSGSGKSSLVSQALVELQRPQRGTTLYVLDQPTTGLHADDVERLLGQPDRLVTEGNSVVVVEHDMQVIASSDYVIDIGPGARRRGRKRRRAGLAGRSGARSRQSHGSLSRAIHGSRRRVTGLATPPG